MRSPFHITYDDLISSTERTIAWMEKNYPGMITTSRISAHQARHNLECEKVKLRLLQKFKKDPQVNLFNEFENVKK